MERDEFGRAKVSMKLETIVDDTDLRVALSEIIQEISFGTHLFINSDLQLFYHFCSFRIASEVIWVEECLPI